MLSCYYREPQGERLGAGHEVRTARADDDELKVDLEILKLQVIIIIIIIILITIIIIIIVTTLIILIIVTPAKHPKSYLSC